jgi:hypothetical protein
MIIEVKPSSKWDPNWWDIVNNKATESGRVRDIKEPVFFSALSQLHFYMAHSGANYAGPLYGVLLTDKFLVPVKRDGSTYGELQIATPIPWTRHFKEGELISDFTIQSALWYMCMLSSMPNWHYDHETTNRPGRKGMEETETKHREQEK